MNGIIGIDIGGANIKISDGKRFALSSPFALWQHPEKLEQELRQLLTQCPDHQWVAATMTGELTDCFENKQAGVNFIVDALCQASKQPARFYLLNQQFVDSDTCKQHYSLAAASNWHAIANYLANNFQQPNETTDGILIDIGSTTTDVIPYTRQKVLAIGTNDYERLTNNELVYTAVVRSALNGILKSVEHRGQVCPTMNEMFATTLDTNIVLGHLAENTNTFYSADGNSTSKQSCLNRLARVIGKDNLSFTHQDAMELSQQYFDQQTKMVSDAIQAVVERCNFHDFQFVVSGQGEFLATAAIERLSQNNRPAAIVNMSQVVTADCSTCMTSWSLANLFSGQLQRAAMGQACDTIDAS